jgi:hypothetical protein
MSNLSLPPLACRTLHVALLALILQPMLSLRAAESKPAAAERRVAVGTCLGPEGTLLRREAPGKPWQFVPEKETVYSGDLVLGMPGATVESKNGAVRLSFMGDLAGLSPYPIIETAVRFHANPDVDLDFTLDRGRVDLIDLKDQRAAQVHVRVRNETFALSLDDRGARAALELYGRWPRGRKFTTDPKPGDVPLAELIILALNEEVHLKHGPHIHRLKAPPGPALIEWDNVTGLDKTPKRLDELPDWATAKGQDTPMAKRRHALLAKFRQVAKAKSLDAAIDEFLDSDDLYERRLAVFAMGALDELPRLGKALAQPRSRDVWDDAVVALEHWLGRGPGQDQKLYKALIAEAKYRPVDAESVLQLLHGFSDEDLADPETYECLIDFLQHDRIAIRGLAYWHLYRLVPEGRKIAYDPLAKKEERDRAQKEWKKLIPHGKLPPKPKLEDKE